MQSVYKWAGVEFDRWYWESDVDADSVKTIKKYFAEGKLQESQGAIGLDFSAENLGFCMLLKTDGTGLYATKDVELARRKFEDFKIEKSIYVVDMRQALHFKQVFKTLEVLGFEQAKNCFHLQYNFVELPDGAMSSRKGNIVALMLLVEKMREHVKKEYLSRYAQEWTAAEIDLTADTVAKGAIKYGMLRQDTNKKIVFDMNEWLKLDGESGPFIQYSYARINSLLRKFGTPEKMERADLLTHPTEVKLMQHLMNFNTVVLSSAENYKPATLCTYLYETAKKFNGFYHDCAIGNAEDAEIKQARLALAAATGLTLKNGLALLGIPVPERM
jgi:arginyl-tRNA synthetase